jgi:hypothetical protein
MGIFISYLASLYRGAHSLTQRREVWKEKIPICLFSHDLACEEKQHIWIINLSEGMEGTSADEQTLLFPSQI